MATRRCLWSYAWLIALLLCQSLEVLGGSSPLQLDLALAQRPPASQRVLQRDNPLTSETQGTPNFRLVIVNATVGTPPQTIQLSLAFNTGDTLIVATGSEACNSYACELGTYDTNSSSTYQYLNSNFSISYLDGTSSVGDYVTDDFTLGGTTIDDLQFGLSINSTSIFENILGLGYIGAEASPNAMYQNLPARLYQDGTTKVNGFSLWFDGPNATTGKLALGSVDTGKFTGALETFPISLPALQYEYVSIKLDSVSATTATGTTQFDNSSTYMNIDAGTTSLYFPDDIFTQIVQSLGASFDGTNLVHSRGTSYNDSTLDFTFGSITFQIPLDHLSHPYNDTHDVIYVFNSTTSDGTGTLGVPFLRQAYTVYDYSHNQISLAPVLQSQKSNVTLIQENGVAGLISTGESASSAQPSKPSGTSTPTGSGASSSTPSKHGLSTSSKIGIGVGVGIGVPLLLGLAAGFFLMRRRKRGTKKHQSSTAAELPATNGGGPGGVISPAEKDGFDNRWSTTTGSNGPHTHASPELQSKHTSTIPTELPANDSQANGMNLGHKIRRKPLSELS